MRDGRYAIYKGKEYEFDREDDGQYYLIFRNPSTEELNKLGKDSFYEEFENFWRKDVKKTDVDSIYVYNTVCKYKGYEFQVLGEQEDKYLITTSNAEGCKKLGLDIDGQGELRGEYRQFINKDEVTDIKEEKILEFENKKVNSNLMSRLKLLLRTFRATTMHKVLNRDTRNKQHSNDLLIDM